MRIPVRRAEAGECRHEEHVAGVEHARRKFFDFRGAREELELRREVAVPIDDTNGSAGALRDCNARLDLGESSLVSKTTPRTADVVMEAPAQLIELERLHQRDRLGADLDRLLEAAAEHQETRVRGQYLRPCNGRRPVSTDVEGEGDVAVHCSSVAELPGETRGRRGRFGFPFDVSRDPKDIERLRQKLQSGIAEQEKRTCAIEQEPRPSCGDAVVVTQFCGQSALAGRT